MNDSFLVNATSIADLLSLDNEVFRSYIFYSSLLVMKVFLLVPMTAIQRFKYMVSFWKHSFFSENLLVTVSHLDLDFAISYIEKIPIDRH